MHYFIADTHFGDGGARRFWNRPFASTDQMDAAMLAALQVEDDADLWILGDFAASEAAARHAFERIPGRKHLVRGNHDDAAVLGLGWASVHDLAEIKADGQRFVLCHYPMLSWPGQHRGAIHLFGHVHLHWAGAGAAVNVGVDHWNFRPVTPREAEIKALAAPPLTVTGWGR